MAIKDGLLADFDHEMAKTRLLLERVPADRWAWTPHPKSMTIGALSTHIANIPVWGEMILTQTGIDLLTLPPNRSELPSRAEVLADFDAKVKRTRAAMNKTDAELTAGWTLRRGDQQMFTAPRIAAVRSFVLHHIIHHRGQLSVYLRLRDIPLPSIYGPTADEG